jgi:hypothetical protein
MNGLVAKQLGKTCLPPALCSRRLNMATKSQLDRPAAEIFQLAARRWQLFPVRAKGKEPLIDDWPNQASTDPTRLKFWLRRFPGCNWAAATGLGSGFFVLDVDGEEGLHSLAQFERSGKSLPETLTVRTGRGSHLYFAYPDKNIIRNSAAKLAPGLDIRGAGGYVVIPPSVHFSGSVYGFVREDCAIAPAPEWLLGMLRENAVPSQAPVIGADEHRAAISRGKRNSTLTSQAGAMRSKGMTEPSIEAALLIENKERCDPPLPDSEVREIAHSVSKYPPRQVKTALPRRAEILTLSDVAAREVDWLWKLYLAYGTMAMLSGDPDAGKTFIALAIAAALTVGATPYTGEPCEPCDVLYLSVENSPECVLRPRFDSLGGDAKRFHLLQGSIAGEGEGAERSSVHLGDVSLLRDALMKTKARLVVVDPIQSYLGAEVDAHRSNETRPVLDGLSRLANEFGCCILLVRHLGKAPTGRAIHRGLGSIDLTGAVRTELMAGTAADGSGRAMVQVKNNLGPFGKALGYTIDTDGSFRWTGESELTASSLLAAESCADEEGAGQEAEDFLRDTLRGGPRLQKEIMADARQVGIAERTLRRSKKRLRIVARKRGMEGGWEWELPEDGQA